MQTTDPSEEQIAELARSFWEKEGQPEGLAEEHWRRAEEQLRNKRTGNGAQEALTETEDAIRG